MSCDVVCKGMILVTDRKIAQNIEKQQRKILIV